MLVERKFQEAKLILEYREKAKKLSRSILKKWGSHIDVEEIDSVSDLSLCEAASKFDVSKGTSFITFLFYYLKGNLIKAVVTNSSINGVQRDDYLEGTLQGEDNQSSRLLREMINEEIAEASMGSHFENPEESLLKRELYTLSREACQKLDQVEKDIIERIYLKGQQVLDIARELGYSRCHISRIKKKAISDISNIINRKIDDVSDNTKLKGYANKKVVRRKHGEPVAQLRLVS